METSTFTKRPTWASEPVLGASAQELAVEMPAAVGDKTKILPALIDTLRANGPFFDAYRITRHLEDVHRWSCDMDIVEACEGAHAIVQHHLREAEAKWVRESGIAAKLKVGAAVLVNTCGKDGNFQDFTGEITRIDSTYARYLVRIEALGHVQAGDGCHGLIFPFEKFDAPTASNS